MLTIITSSLVAGTYAKYTTTVTGTAKAIVAKWDVSAGKVGTEVDIFGKSKIYDTEDVTDYTEEGTQDTDIKIGTEVGIIAPGTWGSFSYVLTNNSDVNATYTITYKVNEAGIPLEWSTDGAQWNEGLENVTAIAMIDGEKQIDIYWRWPFDGDDTSFGEAENLATPSVEISVTFEQVN